MQSNVTCRYAPSLGALEGEPEEVWGTPPYVFARDKHRPCVFFGLYDLRDYIALWRHQGKAWVLWAGSDIRHIRARFIFNDGKLRWLSDLFAGATLDFRSFLIKHVLSKAEHWVENEAEAWQLNDMGIKVTGIAPSFMGNVKDYKVKFKPGNKVWVSCSRGREEEYGWEVILQIAWALPEIEFHLFGSRWDKYSNLLALQGLEWDDYAPNVIMHGRIPKAKMNKLISNMQCGLRLNKHDGFSEVTAKSILWGQYPITYLYNPLVHQFGGDTGLPSSQPNLQKLASLLKEIPKKRKPNKKARDYYLHHFNRYPWNRYV